MDGVRLARESAETGAVNRRLVEGAAFALENEAARLPQDDELRVRLLNAAVVLHAAALGDGRSLALLRLVEDSLR